jgi:hypothetical protein
MPKTSQLILEFRQEGRKIWAIRFYQDGLVKEYSDSTMVYENDDFITRPIPLAWRKLTQLSAAELEKLTTTLRQSYFYALPTQVGDPEGIMDATLYTWIVNLDGRKKTVHAVGSQASNHPLLKMLSELIQEVTADAFDRTEGEELSHNDKDADNTIG